MMKWKPGGGMLILLIGFFAATTMSQENAVKTLSPSLKECYNEETYKVWNQLPHNMKILIELIRKIEDYSSHNVELLNIRYLSTAILHRFRQDGIVRNPDVRPREGILPYAPLGKQFYRHAQILRVIPGNAFNFPNESLTAVERCTLHSMLSSSIDIYDRGDEGRTCKYANYAFRRYNKRSVVGDNENKEDVETLTPEQIEMMKNEKNDATDPNFQYPTYPRNHPSSERLINNPPPLSRCPNENGVVNTPWGAVSGGAILAGIAAGVEPQLIRIDDLIGEQLQSRVAAYDNARAREIELDNKYLATLAGDLAEVALKQGPQSNRFGLGVEGNWNSSARPLFYFLKSNENLEMTAAEIRGGIDGLILADKVPYYLDKARNLRLSQALDMYYGDRGLFERNLRACKRREIYLKVAPSDALKTQTLSAAILLSPDIAPATFTYEAVEGFVKQAVNDLNTHIPTMNRDDNCEQRLDYSSSLSSTSSPISETAANLTIIIDPTAPFDTTNKILLQLLMSTQLQIGRYNSHYAIVSAAGGSLILNTSHSPLDWQNFNQTLYNRLERDFNLPRTLDNYRLLQNENLNREHKYGIAGGKSDVVVLLHYKSSLSNEIKIYCNDSLKRMKEEVPDATFLVLTHGAKDQWSEVVLNPDDDVITVSTGESAETVPAVDALVTRIKQVPRRLVNTQCGANYDKIGSSQSLKDTVAPGGVNYYRLHPNYFFSDDSDNPPRVKVQSLDSNQLSICESRDILHENATEAQARAKCVTSRSHTMKLDCNGASYINDCRPFYLSISANATTNLAFSCNDFMRCRYPDSIQFTISFENLVCKSGGTRTLIISPIGLLLLLIGRYVF